MREITNEEIEFLQHILYNMKPEVVDGYFRYRIYDNGIRRVFKRSRLIMQLHLYKMLESWEIVHHKDGDRSNDSIENLEVLNASNHAAKHHRVIGSMPKNWKPANTTPNHIQDRIKEISNGMVKINCSEISRRLKREGVEISSMAVKKYLPKASLKSNQKVLKRKSNLK